MSSSRFVVTSLTILVTLVGCAAAHGPSQTEEGRRQASDGRITLAPGQSAAVSDGQLQLRFDDVRRDSRCPTGEQCVAAGSADVVISVTGPRGTTAYTLTGGAGQPASVTHDGEVIALLELQPVPKGTRQIPRAEYRATFQVGGDR
jgi:hypothetical protein